ncbi:hypothetical protein BT63DRAFT_379173 [Microthyrium microscopicum]|uniref:glucan 1,4-alpha-glucosidase n=1 Tax=Microthyrium microscopicum TaxID=703497 RepID=A0A6A6TZ43_9PEZI|nr:hypothetical protein BT63DRAFT_379173 [Microthyrium microscopicum]
MKLLLLLGYGVLPSVAQSTPPRTVPQGLASDITTYLATSAGSQTTLSKQFMFANINVPGAANGTVIAAQSYTAPNYAYNWVRDASLTMDVVQQLYAAATLQTAKNNYSSMLFAYANARVTEQNDPNLQTGLGEPKFNLDNSVFTGPWGRPQNDGPATAAITLMEFATTYIKYGGSEDDINKSIYLGPVKTDLLFVAANWSSPSFDIWEEESSTHFYNHLVSHKALSMGASFAATMGDSETSTTLSAAASAVAQTLPSFWDESRAIIDFQIGPVQKDKTSYQDIAVILGIIHGYNNDGIYSYSNDQVLSTAYHLCLSFQQTYPIATSQTVDNNGGALGIPIGRYPEDVYNGDGTSPNGGNPWFLATAAMAELFYRAASEINDAKTLTVTNTSLAFYNYFAPNANLTVTQYASSTANFVTAVASLEGWGDAFMRLIKFHGGQSGHLSEEYDRNTGYETGAADLTWSYASVLTAALARAELSGNSSYAGALANLGFS